MSLGCYIQRSAAPFGTILGATPSVTRSLRTLGRTLLDEESMTMHMKFQSVLFFFFIWILFVSCANTPTTPLPPPDLTEVSTQSPDPDGFVTVTGDANAAEADSVILLFNDDSGSGVMETATGSGSFQARVAAKTGDLLILQYKIDAAVSYEGYIEVK